MVSQPDVSQFMMGFPVRLTQLTVLGGTQRGHDVIAGHIALVMGRSTPSIRKFVCVSSGVVGRREGSPA